VQRLRPRRTAADADDPFDVALEELGGAENICAG
jgi:hypothetical protein